MPTNLGDVIVPVHFGMRYGREADITLDTLVSDQETREVETETSSGVQTSVRALNRIVKSGGSATLYMIAQNKGADGFTVVEVMEGDALLASKYVSVEGGSFVVVKIEVPLEGAGDHVLTVGENTVTITVEE